MGRGMQRSGPRQQAVSGCLCENRGSSEGTAQWSRPALGAVSAIEAEGRYELDAALLLGTQTHHENTEGIPNSLRENMQLLPVSLAT